MGKSSSDGYPVARGWRLVGEYAPSPGCSGSQGILTWLRVAVQTMNLLPANLELIELAASRAVARAERDVSPPRARPTLVVRVFVSAATEESIAPRNWGFFVLERAAAAMDASDAGANRNRDRTGIYLIELYIYAEASPA